MRTTLIIDDDLLAVARSLAAARSQSVGKVLSDLARRGLSAPQYPMKKSQSGLPVFAVREDAHPITLEDVMKIEDEL